MPRSGVTAARLRKVGNEIGIDTSDVEAGVAKMMNRVTGPRFKKEVCMPAAQIAVTEIRDFIRPLTKTGKLDSAVFADYGDEKKPNVLVGMNYRKAGYAHIVEYGSVRSRAKPYFRPGITAARSPMAASLATNMKKLITEG
jgi:hypothetical protein